ncbi:DUF1491 family protein [Rhodoblastus acidophilus]|uniref:DUF1491 family protein n=1 Tax=Candidatus Rhodoblastus alkanivorans TaxID=2954117 RepID=A0ABS9ZB62_9HYPH|nr:DUF1491 family protein [Candidatus Rhodoblastus alkanivorans]MCI4677977.1 DUF1491 family protein [Candidatus Rhodoblastus alkanivorans]MCI4683872.1 DUF1491 family protein [Candidatus Rhodoblastus alkanivorans]MDI4641190.1 DUF1491 family protein [Rhodoblastus acidophilus]
MRLRTDIWVSAYLRRCASADVAAYLRRRGAPEAGAIFVKIDRLDGSAALFAPAPQSEAREDVARLFARAHGEEWIESAAIEARLAKEMTFDPDLWIVEVEDRAGRNFLDLA